MSLGKLLNHGSRENLYLMIGWLVGIFSRGPYVHLILHGQQGSAKSSAMRTLVSLVDPNQKVLKPMIGDAKAFAISARNSHITSYDNVSRLSPGISDSLCRLATGDSHTARKLFTDDSEFIIQARRPAIINGISELATRGDLRERSIIVTCPSIEPSQRQEEREVQEQFRLLHPQLLGALLDAVSMALRNLNNTVLAVKPRAADFVTFVEAASDALPWEHGEFLSAFTENQEQSASSELNASMLGLVIRSMFEESPRYSNHAEPISIVGTAASLWENVIKHAHDKYTRAGKLPDSPSAFSGEFNRIEPLLNKIGYRVERYRDKTGERIIKISFHRIGKES